MRHVHTLSDIQIQSAWLTIGSFDGVHLGHQKIVRDLTAGAHAAGAPAVVLTFHPHPALVLGKRSRAQYLTTPEQRAEILSTLGVDLLITHPFTPEVAAKSAAEFLGYLQAHLGFRQLWVGYDFAMGHNREGNVDALRRLGHEYAYQLHVVSPVKVAGEVVSSSRIRSLLAEGEVEQAAQLLGRPYRLDGSVTRGVGRGQGLGIPTANLAITTDQTIPARGVYACQAYAQENAWNAVTNIGVRPTFENLAADVHVEAHLLDYNGDLYGEPLQLEFIHHLRGEMRFPSPQALVAQIHADIARARHILASNPDA